MTSSSQLTVHGYGSGQGGEGEEGACGALGGVFFQDLFDFEMEEDPEMYESAGIPLPAMSTPDNSVNILRTIESAFSSVPAMQGSNVKVKVCVMRSNYGMSIFRTCF